MLEDGIYKKTVPKKEPKPELKEIYGESQIPKAFISYFEKISNYEVDRSMMNLMQAMAIRGINDSGSGGNK